MFPKAFKVIKPQPYVRSEATDIRKTFAKVKRELAEQAEGAAKLAASGRRNVVKPIRVSPKSAETK